MSTQQVVNPLGLEVVYVTSIEQLHDAYETDKLGELTASMEANGWMGAPLVGSRELHYGGQDRAYTGSHRWAAWRETERGDSGEAMPVVFIEDICEAHGIDFDALMDEYDGSDFEAVVAAADLLPAETVEAYGLDLDA
jgi:hypothetical protein